jgi:lipopolysaccharide transport system permease protein
MSQPATEDLSEWTKVILPERGFSENPLPELWRYRDLVWQFVVREFTAQYKQTLLGPLWFVLQPLLTTVAFSFLFGRMARMGTDHYPHFLFYMSGLAAWSYFADCVNRTSFTFTKNAQIIGKVYFPRLAIPLASVLSGLLGFAIQLGIFLIGLAFYLWKGQNLDPNWRIVLLPVLVLQVAMLGMGVGCIVAALTTRFRDLSRGIGFIVQLWMYGSSIVFPLSKIPLEDRWIFHLNPMVPVIETFRFAFLGSGVVEKWQLAASFGASAVILLIGVVLFQRASRHVMDTV